MTKMRKTVPWTATKEAGAYGEVTLLDAEGMPVCEISPHPDEEHRSRVVAMVTAAPDMLDALETVKANLVIGGRVLMEETLAAVNAAIAKATGIALLVLALAAPASAGQVVFDAVNDWAAPQFVGAVSGGFGIGQQFTVGATGTLTSIDVAPSGSPFNVRVIGPRSATLAWLTDPPLEVAGWRTLPLDVPLAVAAGDVVSLFFSSSGVTGFQAGGGFEGGPLFYWDSLAGIETANGHNPNLSILLRTRVELAEPILGDLDRDGRVGLSDFGRFKEAFGTSGSLGELKSNFGSRIVTPEPNGLTYLMIGVLTCAIAAASRYRWSED